MAFYVGVGIIEGMEQSTKKVALVTGGSRGIGRAIVGNLARGGYDVVLTWNSNRAAADGAVTDLSSRGYQVRARHSGLTENAGKHGLVWHHHQDTGRMQLINKEVHNVVRHTGGYAIWSKMLNV